jgi:uncharacterized protein (DUF1697 family)
MTDPKEPYFSMRSRVGTITTKENLGKKEITVEITYGNIENIIVRNEKDVADVIQNIPLAKKIWDLHEEVKKEGEKRGYGFI